MDSWLILHSTENLPPLRLPTSIMLENHSESESKAGSRKQKNSTNQPETTGYPVQLADKKLTESCSCQPFPNPSDAKRTGTVQPWTGCSRTTPNKPPYTWVEDSIAFLAHMYPERLLLPENQMIKTLFHTLRAKGRYKGGKWTEYPVVHHGQNSDRENQLAKFLNGCMWNILF
ncbi:hypothetical protein OG21DRAFT_1528432, partial [Imleria badia]